MASPFLANILLDDLDKELERCGLPFVRYADDFVIFTRSRRAAERVFCSVNRYLTQHLRLVVNETESRVVEADGVEYLGFVFRGRRATINVSEKNLSNQPEDSLGPACSPPSNRLVRTRMPGGVVAGRGHPPGYPILAPVRFRAVLPPVLVIVIVIEVVVVIDLGVTRRRRLGN